MGFFDGDDTMVIGKSASEDFSSTVERIQLVDAATGGSGIRRAARFAVLATQDVRIVQGGESATVTSSTGFLLKRNIYWRVDVSDLAGAYLAVVADANAEEATGNIEITCISTLDEEGILP